MNPKIDKRTFEKIAKINRRIPRHLIKNLMTEEKPMEGAKENILDKASYSKATKEQKEYLRKMAGNPMYDKVRQTINPKVAKEIENFIEGEIKKLKKQ